MSFKELLKAELKFVYADVLRRKSVLLMFIMYPYILTAFVLLIGTSVGSPHVFIERVGVDPAVFFITSGFLLMTILGVSDDIFWKPIYDEMMGTQPYIISSPVSRIAYYAAIPIPRLILVIISGLSSITIVLTYYYGLNGLLESLAVLILAGLSAILFITPSMILTGIIFSYGGENWRVINVIRPLLLILIGAYYPRYLMPLATAVVSYLIPSSHIVEAIHRLITGFDATIVNILSLIGVGTALAILYTPFGLRSMVMWEVKKVKEGVKV